jgi:hypothetical protein
MHQRVYTAMLLKLAETTSEAGIFQACVFTIE